MKLILLADASDSHHDIVELTININFSGVTIGTCGERTSNNGKCFCPYASSSFQFIVQQRRNPRKFSTVHIEKGQGLKRFICTALRYDTRFRRSNSLGFSSLVPNYLEAVQVAVERRQRQLLVGGMRCFRPCVNHSSDDSEMTVFDRNAEDEQVLKYEFDSLDKDQNQFITPDIIVSAARADPDRAGFLDSLEELLTDETHIDFQKFRQAADNIPRAKGQRIEWVARLGLDAALARYLSPGDLFDQLKGVKEMTDIELARACAKFAKRDLFRIVKAGRDELRRNSTTQSGKLSEAEKANQKFVQTGSAVTAKFADLDVFLRGPEGLLGQPNPKLEEGMYREHCLRASCSGLIISPNYGVCTNSCWEWHWLVDCESKDLADDLKQRLDANTGLYPGEVGDKVREQTIQFEITSSSLNKSKVLSTIFDEFKKVMTNDLKQRETMQPNQNLEIREAIARGISIISQPAANGDKIVGEFAFPIVFLSNSNGEDKDIRKVISSAAGVDEKSVNMTLGQRVFQYCRFTDLTSLHKQLKSMSDKDVGDFIRESCLEVHPPVSGSKVNFNGAVCAAFEKQSNEWNASKLFRRQGRLRQPKLERFYEQLRSKQHLKNLIAEAKLQKLEVLALSLYTGPLYALYNAVLRGFPQHLVDLLNTKGTDPIVDNSNSTLTVHVNRWRLLTNVLVHHVDIFSSGLS